MIMVDNEDLPMLKMFITGQQSFFEVKELAFESTFMVPLLI